MERNVEIDKISDGKRYGANDLVKVGCDDCRGCSACCNGMGDSIVLDPMDVYRLEKKLGKTMEEILLAGNVALRVVDGVILPHLKMTEQSDQCSFLNEEGRCSIHDARPGFCRMFPLGRLYEDGTFSYFLQVNECPKENKTKVKVRRWLDTPELGKYEAFTTEWHYYLKKKQNAARESEDDAFRQQISMNILKLFYLLPYDGNTDFYTQFAARIRTRTEDGLGKADCPVLLVTSSVPGEGKTTVAVNLAEAFAKKKYRIVLLDGDLRNPSVLKCIGLSERKGRGIIGVLKGQISLDEALTDYRDLSLKILPGVGSTQNPAGLLRSARMKTLIEELKEDADLLIIDTPPCGVLSDASLLGGIADSAVLVVHQGTTKDREVQRALEFFEDSQIPVCGYVLNGVPEGATGYGYSTYGGYGYGKYGYGYGKYGYGKEKEGRKSNQSVKE